MAIMVTAAAPGSGPANTLLYPSLGRYVVPAQANHRGSYTITPIDVQLTRHGHKAFPERTCMPLYQLGSSIESRKYREIPICVRQQLEVLYNTYRHGWRLRVYALRPAVGCGPAGFPD